MLTDFLLFSFDDSEARGWLPFALTRPIGEVLFGTETLRARAERALGTSCEGHLVDRRLVGFQEAGAPPCTTAGESGTRSGRLLLSSRFVPGDGQRFRESVVPRLGNRPLLLVVRQPTGRERADGLSPSSGRPDRGDQPAGAWLPPGTPAPACFDDGGWPDWAAVAVEGWLLGSPWELIAANAARIRRDAERHEECDVPASVHRVGTGRVVLGEGVEVEPSVVLNTVDGPIVLAEGVRVRAHSRIAGPFYAGPDSTILGGSVSASSLGPCCKVRGEVESSVVLGFANKAHDGFLGHSIVGRWANLGAMTTNSDLKNNYGPVRALVRRRPVETGLLKGGCLLGDHVRTGIGTLLTAGSVVEAGANLFGAGGVAPKYVPPFSWGAGSGATPYDIERFLDATERIMLRRGVTLSEGMRSLYRRAFAETAALRGGAAALRREAGSLRGEAVALRGEAVAPSSSGPPPQD